MSLSSLPLILVAGLVILFLIYRQFVVREAGEWRRTILIPLLLIVWGVLNVSHLSSFGAVDITIIATGLSLGIILGIARGYATHIWRDAAGIVWQKGTIVLAILWALSIAVRIGLSAAGGALGVKQVESLSEIPLFFGVTLAAQNAIVLVRMRSGGSGASDGGATS